MMIHNIPFHQAMRPIAPVLLGLTLLTGCASQVALTKPARESIRAVRINKDVKLPDDMFYAGGEGAMGMFGLVGVAVAAAAAQSPKAQLKNAMQQGQIDVAQIVREQFMTQLVEANLFPSIMPEGGDAEVRLEVRQYGFAIQMGPEGGLLKPTLGVMGTLIRTDGTVLWQKFVVVTSGDNQTPGHLLYEYVSNPPSIREAYIVAAKIASEMLVKSMRQD